MTDLVERVRVALRDHVGPAMGLDADEMVVVAVEDGIASMRLAGACASCPATIPMLLTGLALFDTSAPETAVSGRLETLSDQLSTLLPGFQTAARSARRPDRAVFVGSGPLAYAAREAALKVMELSAGQIPALWDSSLGFRHGPKSFVLPGTDIWVFASADPQTRAYDADLIAELRQQFPGSTVTAPVVPQPFGDLWSVPLYIALAQIMAVVWSDALGLPVDDPFAGQGTLSRVVSGVTLHPVVPK